MKYQAIFACAVALSTMGVSVHASAAETFNAAFAGSMGVVMDKGLGPVFAKSRGVEFHGQGKGAYAMARLIASKQVAADVFISINPGPMEILKKAGLIGTATPVASTSMVIAYNPKGKFGPAFEASAKPGAKTPWYKVLQSKGLKFGRTDPVDDPQGQNIIFTMLLAQKYYKVPGLEKAVLGPVENHEQVFLEGHMLTRLEAGQVDASSGYKAAVISAKLPYVSLPDQINLSDPDMDAKWYSKVSFHVKDHQGKDSVKHVQPLVYYAAVLKNARHPKAAQAFIDFMKSAKGQKIFTSYGYDAPKGGDLYK